MKFQEEGTWCVLYDRTEGERLVVVLRKYFSYAANESYGTCVCVGGGGVWRWVCVMDLHG
jgi:hypothetical protein